MPVPFVLVVRTDHVIFSTFRGPGIGPGHWSLVTGHSSMAPAPKFLILADGDFTPMTSKP